MLHASAAAIYAAHHRSAFIASRIIFWFLGARFDAESGATGCCGSLVARMKRDRDARLRPLLDGRRLHP
jgi:hypothetical protein